MLFSHLDREIWDTVYSLIQHHHLLFLDFCMFFSKMDKGLFFKQLFYLSFSYYTKMFHKGHYAIQWACRFCQIICTHIIHLFFIVYLFCVGHGATRRLTSLHFTTSAFLGCLVCICQEQNMFSKSIMKTKQNNYVISISFQRKLKHIGEPTVK